MATDLDRFYELLTEKTGIERDRDPRLELIAMDRALELRYHVGLSVGNPITHEQNQLRARVYPLEPSGLGATENASWHYYPTSWVEPIQAAVEATLPVIPGTDAQGQQVGFWNSTVHRQQLQDPRWTSWGCGIHYQDVEGGSRRWYFITVFGQTLREQPGRAVRVLAGTHAGIQFSASGLVFGELKRTLKKPSTAHATVRWDVPGRGPHLFIVDGTWRNFWLPESPISFLRALDS